MNSYLAKKTCLSPEYKGSRKDDKVWYNETSMVLNDIRIRILRGEEMGLFDPVWMTDNKKKQEKAIEYVRSKVNDDETLLRIIKEAYFSDVKKAAARKLTSDQARLEAVMMSKGISEQDTALDGLTDKRLIDKRVYFSIIDSYTREKLINEISDEALLEEIVLCDSVPKNRLTALEKTTDERIARSALGDKDENVRAEAVFHIQDNDVLSEYLANHGKIPNKKEKELRRRIDTFTKEQLERLLKGNVNDPSGIYGIRIQACEKLGHQRGENCRCVNCGKKLEHLFDAQGVCRYCGAKQVTERETLSIMKEPYGYRDNLVIIYPDGKKEMVQQGKEVVTADQDKMKWLLSDY